MAKDFYKTLGLERGASDDDIKKAFRALAHKYHPDKTGGDEAKFKEINGAYQVLGDPKKKAQYDQFGSAAFEQGGGGGFSGFGGQGMNFENMGDFAEMFGDMFGMGGRRGGESQARRGRDIEVSVRLPFHDAAFGAERAIELRKPVACSACDGTGVPHGAKMQKCGACNGQGRVRQIQRTILGSFEAVATCSTCGGVGNVPEKRCEKCAGEGAVRETRSIRVKIPAGIDDGESIRLSGEGEAGTRGGRSGDLFLRVRVDSDKRFERDGFDLRSEIRVPMSEAALGVTREVETLDGAVELKIPSGTQSGDEIRLKGRGITRLGSDSRGDQYVSVIVETPRKLSRRAKELLEELKGEGA